MNRILTIAFLFLSTYSIAATYYVNSTTGDDDTNNGSIGAPFRTFNKAHTVAAASGDIIDLTGTFDWSVQTTNVGSPTGYTISKALTIRGQGIGSTFIQAQSSAGTSINRCVFYITASGVVIENLTIRYGYVSSSVNLAGGIALAYNAGNVRTLTLNSVEITQNTYSGSSMPSGGTISPGSGASTAGGIAIGGNSGDGGILHMNKCIVRNNIREDNYVYGAGGIYFAQGCQGYLKQCLISDNSASSVNTNPWLGYSALAGGICSQRFNILQITNCVLSGNTTTQCGGALNLYYSYDFVLTNNTIVNNSAGETGGGIHYESAGFGHDLLLKNNIIANNNHRTRTTSAPNDLFNLSNGNNAIYDNGNNIIEFFGDNSSNTFTFASSSISGNQSNLFGTGISNTPALAANSTNYVANSIALSAGSVAINSGSSTANSASSSSVAIPTEDIRGFSRSGIIDIGSFELAGSPTITTSGTLTSFTKCSGSASASQSFNVSGSDMSAAISIAALTGFEYCLTSGGTYTTTLTVGAAGTIASTPVFVRLQSTANNATYAANNIVLSSTNATSQNVSASGTVNASVSGTITGAATVCSGNNSTILTLSGHTGSITRWESSLDNFASAGTTIANTTSTLTATNLSATTSYRTVVTSGSCAAANSASATLTVNPNNTWTGTTNNSWNTATNWSCGVVPTANHHVIISSGNPEMDVDFTNPSGKTFTISGTGTLTINAGRTLTIAGTTDFGGKLVTLKSDATGTAAIGTITGTLSNASNVTVERYIPASARRYRFLASPVVGGTSLQWRDNAGSTAGRGTHITGGTNSANYDVSTTPQASAFKYTESLSSATNINQCWEAINGNTNLVNGTGYRVFIRGDRTIDINTTINTTNNATTLWVNGTYPSGTITLPVSFTAGKGDGWNLVGNPYPCTIDYEASSGWVKTNMSSGVAIFRPSSNSYAYSLSTVGANPSNLAINGGSRYIASGQAFFVKANSATPALTCTEAVKVTNQGSPIILFKGVPANQLRLTLTQDSSNIDETLIAFATNYKDAFDNNEDITKIPNANVNISTVVGTEKYAAINLTSNNYKEKVMPISVWSNKNGDLQLSFSQLAGFDAGVTVFLKDKYLNTTTPIEQDKKININLNDISKGDNRFELIFKNSATNIEQVLFSNAQLSVYPNPATNLLNVNISNANFKNSSVTIYNVSGKQLMNSTMNDSNTALNIESLSNGVYFINVSNENGFNKTVKFVK